MPADWVQDGMYVQSSAIWVAVDGQPSLTTTS
jgi:hypothetical protein